MTTRLLLAKDREPALLLNAEAEGGEIRAELLDAQGNPIPGYTREDCRPLNANGHQQEVVWEGRENLAPVVAQGAFSIRLYLNQAAIYGFRVISPRSVRTLF